ncbi:MAG TPA: CoA pyrophosphatase [Ktedonobacterales bacterium]
MRRKGRTETMSGAPEFDTEAPPSRALLLRDANALAAFLTKRLAPIPITPDATAAADHIDESELQALHPDPRFRGAKPRQAAVLAPIYAREGRPHLLFTRRSPDLRAHSGEISFPGGSYEPQDGSLAHTALRETHEELGLERARVALLGALSPTFTVVSNFFVTPYVGWLGEGLPALHPQESEVAEIIEAPLSALDDPGTYHSELWSRGGESHAVHFYDFGSYRIWGLTGRMLNQLLGLLPPRDIA